jgi:Sarcosine oxidase, delta subunit family
MMCRYVIALKKVLSTQALQSCNQRLMLQIPCPYCGLRDEPELTFGGPSHLTRPRLDVDDETWSAHLFNRKNPPGYTLSAGNTSSAAANGST